MRINNRIVLYLLALAVSVVFCYANILQAPFLWDDEVMVVGNPLITNIQHIPAIFTASAFGQKFASNNFYRPLQILTYVFDYQFWALNPFGYHLTNVILHIINCFLLFLLLLRFRFSAGVSYVIAQLFAIHPVHIESVTYIAGRGDLLYLLFCLCSLIAFIHAAPRRIAGYLIAVLCYVLALISKENAVPLPLILTAYVFIWQSAKQRCSRQIFWLLVLNSLMVVFVAYRLLPGSQATQTLSWIANATLLDRVLTWPQIIITYFRLLVFPFPLHMEYQFVNNSVWSPYLWAGLPISGFCFYKLFQWTKQKRIFWLSLIWFFSGLLPVYNVIMPLASTVREHWLYLPSIGFFILGGYLGKQFLNKSHQIIGGVAIKTYGQTFFILLIIYFGGATLLRNYDWRLPLRLYQHDVLYEPNSFLLHNNIGVELLRRGDILDAKQAFINAIQTAPGVGYGTAYNNLGVILEAEGKKRSLESFSL